MVADPCQLQPTDDAARRAIAYALSQTEQAARGDAVSIEGLIDPVVLSNYEVQSLIHRGGQGFVCRAVQRSTGKTVAIKFLHDGQQATEANRARLKREAEILVRLNHPNIVGISDSGITSGRHYFVMDYVEGVALDAYVRRTNPSQRETLGLVVKVCEAVDSAHQKGIVHRDLKPSNIRVTPEGVPHVLDFGMARMVGGMDPTMTMATVTEPGQFVGSLPWAAPEQARGEWERVDSRTDVYSLGVMLYQLLTKAFPYSVTGAMGDVLGAISHADPIRPSARQRGINDELETIVLTCLQKEPLRRYQNAGELAKDIARYLNGEPIAAKRDSTWYVMTKRLRRYRLAVVALLSLAMLGVAGSLIFASLYRQKTRAESDANRVAALMASILSGVAPSVAQGKDTTMMRTMLDAAVQRIRAGELNEATAANFQLRMTIGDAYRELGALDDAKAMLDEAVAIARVGGAFNANGLAYSLHDLGAILSAQGKYDEAVRLYEESLVERARLYGPEDVEIAKCLASLGSTLKKAGKYPEAESKLREAVRLLRTSGGERSQLATALNNLGLLCSSSGRLDEAGALLSESASLLEELHGKHHPNTLSTLGNLGIVHLHKKEFDEAERLFREVLAGDKENLGDRHPDVAIDLNNLGKVLIAKGAYREAESCLRESLQMRLEFLGEEHPSVATARSNLGELLLDSEQFEEAEELLLSAHAIRSKSLGDKHELVAQSQCSLGTLYLARGRVADAKAYFEQARNTQADLPELKKRFDIGVPLSGLAAVAIEESRFDVAAQLSREAQAIYQRTVGDTHWRWLEALSLEGSAHARQGDFQTAESMLLRAAEGVIRGAATVPPLRKKACFVRLVTMYESWHSIEGGQGHDNQADEWRAKMTVP